MNGASKAIEDVIAERRRQIEAEGWTPEHDDEHDDESLAMAAACYAAPQPIYVEVAQQRGVFFADPWPWSVNSRGEQVRSRTEWEKEGKPRRRQLVIAAALLLAEIERMDRAE